jgi:uncharacterized beta-barrel protein YwiB (DUF1934 family)
MLRSFKDIYTREEAQEFGSLLCSKGVFEHVNNKHDFLDGHYFYRLGNDYLTPKEKERSATSWLKNTLLRATETATDILKDPETSMNESMNKISNIKNDSSFSVLSTDGRSVEMTRQIVIDLDPQHKSVRSETAFLHYDTVYNVKNCYHFQIHWLVCTARLIEDMLAQWSRIAEKCGLKLVEAPVEQTLVFANDDPFQSVVPIKLAVKPPSTKEILSSLNDQNLDIPDLWFEFELASRHGFVLDVEADDFFPNDGPVYSYEKTPVKYTQYVHRSGLAFIQVLPDGEGFYWVNNRQYITSITSLRTQAQNNHETLRNNFEAFCSDKEELVKFYKSATEKLQSVKNLGSVLEDIPDDIAKSNLMVQTENGEMKLVD